MNSPDTPEMMNGLVKFIGVEEFIRHKWLNVFFFFCFFFNEMRRAVIQAAMLIICLLVLVLLKVSAWPSD